MKQTLILMMLAISVLTFNGCGKKVSDQKKTVDAVRQEESTLNNNESANQETKGTATNSTVSPVQAPAGATPSASQQNPGTQTKPESNSAVVSGTGSQPKSPDGGKQSANSQQNSPGDTKNQAQDNTGDKVIKSDNQPSKEETAKVFKELDKELEELENVLQQMDDVGEDTLNYKD